MHKFIFLFSFLFFVNAEAAPYNFTNYWSKETIQTSDSKVTLFTKNSPVSYLKNIATMTLSKGNKEPLVDVLGFFKKVVGTTSWQHSTLEELEIYETYSKESTSIYRLIYNTKTKEYSFGSVKLRFAMPSYLELHLLQVDSLVPRTVKKSKKTAEYFFDLFFAKAFAGPLEDAITNLLNGVNPTITAVGGNIQTGLTNVGTGIQNGFNGTTTAINGVRTEVAGARTEAGRIADGAHSIADQIRETREAAVSKATAAKLAAVVAFSGTITAALTTALISGTWEMAKRAYYEIKGEFSPEEKKARVERFEQSLKTFKELSEPTNQLEQKLTFVSAAIAYAAKSPTEDVLAQYDKDIAALKAQQTEAAADCPNCQAVLLNNIKALESLKEIAIAAGVTTRSNLEKGCEQLDSFYTNWVANERLVTNARAFIIQDARVFMGLVTVHSEIDEKWQEQRMQSNACAVDSKIAAIEAKATELNCKNNPDSINSVCRDWRSYQKEKAACDLASATLVTEDLKSSMRESAADFNLSIAQFSTHLNSLTCSKVDEKKACVEAGPLLQSKNQMKTRLNEAAAQCPNRNFSKTIARAAAVTAPPAPPAQTTPVTTAPAETTTTAASGNIFTDFGNLINNAVNGAVGFIKGKPAPPAVVGETQDRTTTQALTAGF